MDLGFVIMLDTHMKLWGIWDCVLRKWHVQPYAHTHDELVGKIGSSYVTYALR